VHGKNGLQFLTLIGWSIYLKFCKIARMRKRVISSKNKAGMGAQDIIGAITGGLIQSDRLLTLDSPLGNNVLLRSG